MRESLEYVRRFRGKTFVISPDPLVAGEALETNLRDLLLIIDVGIRIALVLPDGHETINGQRVVHYANAKLYNPSLAADVAVEEKASKLIYLCTTDGIHDSSDLLINRLDLCGAQELLAEEKKTGSGLMTKVVTQMMREQLLSSVWACQNGVDRAHFVCGTVPGLMLAELFTSAGAGTMVTYQLETYERLARGTKEDREKIAVFLASNRLQSSVRAIVPENFILLYEDDEVQGTICLVFSGQVGHLTCIAVSSHLNFDKVLHRLLGEVISLAREHSLSELYVGLEQNQSWLLISPALKQAGFSFSGDDTTWHLTLD